MDHQQQPPPSAIALTAKYSWMAFVLGLFRPFLAINGHPVPAGWGRTVVPVPPGQYHVHVHVPYFLPPRIGTADTLVPVHPGQVVEVEYRAPVIGWLGGSIGPAPQRYRGVGASIAFLLVPLLLLCCIGGLVGALTLAGDDDPVAAPVPLPTLTPLPTRSFALPSPSPTSSASESPEATLRPVPARTLVGPSYAAGEKTYTMALAGVPFAFRTPPTWGCMAGKTDIEDAKGWVCVDEGNPFDASAPAPDRGKRLQLLLRPCPAPCGKAERAELSEDWFGKDAPTKAAGDRTTYGQGTDSQGRYTLGMSHFFPATGTPEWQVAVGVYSQPKTKAVVQKMVNDILTQAG
ncbi:hypothetical protein [Actinoplanes sp. RD1]|uniref:hypothetical protein n=1 Tax=Actinoplanes sp. RD1 TaxID=3064538 RepID=UPI00274054FB|nr:hypothetical protein [Actinoplanes sp. RD1]